MKTIFCVGVAILALSVSALAAERTLSGSEIKRLLPKIAARGNSSYQTFEANGHTDYQSGGRPSVGQWEVRGDQYCSVWPPSDVWACFKVVLDETNNWIFWVEANGAREKNRYEPRNLSQ